LRGDTVLTPRTTIQVLHFAGLAEGGMRGWVRDHAGHSRLLLPGLDPDWDPAHSGSYNLVWELHTGGEFKTVSGVVQNS
jgi:hypothetical protein